MGRASVPSSPIEALFFFENGYFCSMRKHLSVVVFLCCCMSAAAQAPALFKGIHSTIFEKQEVIRIFSDAVREPVRIFVIADTHVFRTDEREDPYREYSARMSKAYNQTRHFRTGADTDPESSLVEVLALARKHKADAVAVLGDMVSFPTEAGVEWVKKTLDASGLPWYYTNGNHDWHYEGLPGTEMELRAEWTRRRLLPLYQGHEPALYSVEVKGVKLVFLDNAVYEITPEQARGLKQELRGRQPKLLLGHIAFYAPGYSAGTVGNPAWGYETDKGYNWERRPRWPGGGFGPATYEAWKTVLKATRRNNLLATFSGHHHTRQESTVGTWHQFTVEANARGGYFEVIVEPLP